MVDWLACMVGLLACAWHSHTQSQCLLPVSAVPRPVCEGHMGWDDGSCGCDAQGPQAASCLDCTSHLHATHLLTVSGLHSIQDHAMSHSAAAQGLHKATNALKAHDHIIPTRRLRKDHGITGGVPVLLSTERPRCGLVACEEVEAGVRPAADFQV